MSNAYNSRRNTNRKTKPANNIRKSKAGSSKNNIRRTRTSNPKDPFLMNDKIRTGVKKLGNKLKTLSRRDYIAKTTKAGVDEFNNTTIRPSKGGKSATTGEVAKFNKGKAIKASAKGVRKAKLGTAALAAAEALISNSNTAYGKKVKKARQQMDKAKRDALEYVRKRLKNKK